MGMKKQNMLKPGQQFRVNSIEELKEAYKHLDFYHDLEDEIKDFEISEMNYVKFSKDDLLIILHNFDEDYERIPNPFKQTNMQELIENLKTLIKSGSKYTDKHIEDFINNYISNNVKVYDKPKNTLVNYLEENMPDIDTAMNDLHESAKDLGYKVTVTFESE